MQGFRPCIEKKQMEIPAQKKTDGIPCIEKKTDGNPCIQKRQPGSLHKKRQTGSLHFVPPPFRPYLFRNYELRLHTECKYQKNPIKTDTNKHH